MRIMGVLLQRDEIDVVLFNVLHHLNMVGLDRIIVGDNGSSDGSREALLRLQRRNPRLIVLDMPGEFQQGERVSAMNRMAVDLGADWVVPLDADEFLPVSRTELQDLLQGSRDAALRMDIRNFVQRRSARTRRMHRLATMLHMVPPAGSLLEAMDLVNQGKLGFVQSVYPPKYIWRANRDLAIDMGNHGSNLDVAHVTKAVPLYHVPLRSKAAVDARRARIERFGGGPEGECWHIKRLARIDLEEEWQRNSAHKGALDVNGARPALKFDPFFARLFARHAFAVRNLVRGKG